MLTKSSGKEIEENNNVQIICVLDKLSSNSKDRYDLSIDFHRKITSVPEKSTENKTN